MFANAYQSGFISIFFSVGSNPLVLWDKQVKNGHIRRIIDDEVKSLVLEIGGTNVATTYITCPIRPRASLGITLPFLVMVIKNLKKYFTFEIQILDDKDMRRRFRVSNFQSTTKVSPFCTTMPIGLSGGWNQVQFNLADFTKRAYGSTYLETIRVQVHANVRIRRIYFTDHLATEDEMPNEFKLFGPGKGRPSKVAEETRTSGEKPPEEVPPLPSPVEEGRPEGELGGAPPTPTSPVAEGEQVAGDQAPAPSEAEGTALEGAAAEGVGEGEAAAEGEPKPPEEGAPAEGEAAAGEASPEGPAGEGAAEGAPAEGAAEGVPAEGAEDSAAPPAEGAPEEAKPAEEGAPTESTEAPTETAETTETEAPTTTEASEPTTTEPPPSESAPTEEPPPTEE